MYFCIACNKVHQDDTSVGKLFATGYILVDEKKVALGICKSELSKQTT